MFKPQAMDRVNKLLWYVMGALLLLYLVSSFKVDDLPLPEEILPALYKAPVQAETQKGPFARKYLDKDYMIRPQYSYDIYGLVVTQKDLDDAWFNIYYDNDPYQLKDLCVIWGTNLKNSNYLKAKFWSDIWTCWTQTQFNAPLNGMELSNNHILPDTQEIADTLQNIKIGDQIHFKGYLVNYSVIGRGGGERESSTSRGDTGKRACEVVFVEQLEILKNRNVGWRILNSFTLGAFFLMLFLKIYIFFVF